MSAPPPDLRAAWALRAPERELLAWGLLCVGLGFAMAIGSAQAAGARLGAEVLFAPALLLGCVVVIHLGLVALRCRGDQLLTACIALLAGFGLLVRYRMGAFDPGDPTDPGLYALPLGVTAMLVTCALAMRGRHVRLATAGWLWAALSLALVVVVLALGQRFRGAVYGVGLVTPTELLKITAVVFMAWFVDRHAKALGEWRGPGSIWPPLRALWPLVGFWAALAALLLWQRDLGMLAVLATVQLVVLVAGSGRRGYLWWGLGLGVALGAAALGLFAHGQRRLAAWLDPFADPTGASWQILQGLSGMYSGGLWGEGLGAGNPEYTPIAQSDFIYAVIGEEFGFVGCVLLVVFVLILLWRGLLVAERTRDRFGRLLGLGLVSALACQTLLNLGGVTKLIPLTGITLPLISQGGTSLVTVLVMLGLVLALSDGPAPRASGARRQPRRSAQRGAQRPDQTQ
ncbi:MAG: FtsW/RodA/SpoVE family cell cycle protein [Marichromatium sp.]|nr:FtsW/RodA/SpoVE family cell cycle protein [Marichromatium sp.]